MCDDDEIISVVTYFRLLPEVHVEYERFLGPPVYCQECFQKTCRLTYCPGCFQKTCRQTKYPSWLDKIYSMIDGKDRRTHRIVIYTTLDR